MAARLLRLIRAVLLRLSGAGRLQTSSSPPLHFRPVRDQSGRVHSWIASHAGGHYVIEPPRLGHPTGYLGWLDPSARMHPIEGLGATTPDDAGAVMAALREAAEHDRVIRVAWVEAKRRPWWRR